MVRFSLALAAIAALSTALGAQTPRPQDGKESFKLGVVNLKTCFDPKHYDRIKEVDVDLQKMADEYTKKIQDIEKRIVELRERYESLPRDSALRAEKILQLRRAEVDLKFEKEYGRARYLDYYSERKIEIYNEIRRVVTLIAAEQKFDLVLRIETPTLEEQDTETVSQRINNRVVLFYHDSVDITPAVVKRLNDEWAKAKVAPAANGAEWECPLCKKKNKGDACTATPGCKGKKP
jgi:Skp family chaperone for outer membrane proteins